MNNITAFQAWWPRARPSESIVFNNDKTVVMITHTKHFICTKRCVQALHPLAHVVTTPVGGSGRMIREYHGSLLSGEIET